MSPKSVCLSGCTRLLTLTLIAGWSLAWTAQANAEDLVMTAPPLSPEAKTIFNGDDLSGWDGDPELWKVVDGVIRGETTPERPSKGNTFLIWEGGNVKDFELRISFRCNATNNSGIQYRSSRLTEGPKASNDWVLKGYQHEVRNEIDFPNVSGFIYDEKGTRRRICMIGEVAVWDADGKKVLRDDLIDQEGFRKLMKLDDWNEVIIVAKGNNIKHYLNGRLVLDFTDKHPTMALAEGVIGVQLHGGKPMWAEFKDVKLTQY